MENKREILQELKDVAPGLMQLQSRHPYTVSSLYFEGLADAVVEKIKSFPAVSFLTAQNPYTVPQYYFETSPAIILRKVKEGTQNNEVFDELEQLSPVLNTIGKNSVYTVPHGYFDTLGLKAIEGAKRPKAVLLGSFSKAIRYVAAAVIIGLVVVGMFLFIGKGDSKGLGNAKAEVKNLSEQEIVDFLKTSWPTENVVMTVGNKNVKESDIKRSLSKMSDQEIQQFLQENGEHDEM